MRNIVEIDIELAAPMLLGLLMQLVLGLVQLYDGAIMVDSFAVCAL